MVLLTKKNLSLLKLLQMKLKYIFALLVLSSSILIAQTPNYVPTNGLQGWWPFTGNANDLSVNARNGTANNTTLINDRFSNSNSAYSFNGSNSSVSTTYSGILGTNPRAVSFWAKTTTSTTPITAVGWGGNATASRWACMFNYVTSGPTVDGGNGAITYSSTSNIYDNNWHHYIYQFSNSTLNQVQVYIDGVLQTTPSHVYNPNNILNTVSTFSVHFGRIIYSGGDMFFSGGIDDIGIWDRVLTACEIQQLYTASGGTLNLSASSTSICSGSSVSLTVSGATSYTWNTSANGNSIVVSPTATSVYSVTGTSTTGCIGTQTISVNVSPLPGVSINTAFTTICKGQNINLLASGANTYSWSNGFTTGGITISPSVTTTYSVIGTNTNTGCSNSNAVVITVIDCTSLTEMKESDALLTIFPNPNNGSFFISSSIACELILVNNLGQTIRKINLRAANEKMEIKDVAEGIYYIIGETYNNKWSKKIVVNK